MVFNKIKHIKCKIKNSTFILVVFMSPLFHRTATAIYTAFTRLCDGEHYCLRRDTFLRENEFSSTSMFAI